MPIQELQQPMAPPQDVAAHVLGALALAASSVDAHAQDLEPWAYTNAPVGLDLERATGARFYTDNTDFLGGKTLQVSPLYSVQGHLIYSFTAGIWLGLDGTYYTGGRTTVDGKKGESLANARVGLTLSLPINRYNSVKLYANTGVYTRTGGDFDTLGILWQFRWGGGL